MQETTRVEYGKGRIGGSVSIPPSKSFAHRALICAALSRRECTINNIDMSRDMQATFGFIRAIGSSPEYNAAERSLRIIPGRASGSAEIDCIESGSTLRFVIPIMAALGTDTLFVGEGRLPERPIGIYTELLPEHGVSCVGEGLPLKISGKLSPGEFRLRGDVSSQFITGLLLALPLLQADSKIILTTELQSESYVDITISVMESFGVKAEKTDYGYFVPGSQHYKPADYTVEGDWSQAAFFLSLAAFSEEGISISGLNSDSVQGDKKCLEVYSRLGVDISWQGKTLFAVNTNFSKDYSGLRAIELDASDIPDMVPAVAVCCAFAKGQSRIYGAGRLRIKECDRLSAVSDGLRSIGASVKELPEELIIDGSEKLSGGEVAGCNDHRIVMAFSAASVKSENNVIVSDPMSINKSYPGFFRDFEKIGGACNVVLLGK